MTDIKKEYPTLFTVLCTEVFEDIENISALYIVSEDIEEIWIYVDGQVVGKTPLSEVHGWLFNNRTTFNRYNLYETEQTLTKGEENGD
jgi:hypothetical protein